MVNKVCWVYSGSAEEREDLFQEVVMQLWRAWPTFRGDSSFATWAYRVALNTALFRRRKAGAERAREQDADLPLPAPEAPDPAETSEAVHLLHRCIRELREVDRAIVLLHLEQRPNGEIAEFTGLSTGNVAVRLHRIKNALRQCLASHGYDEE